MTGDLVGRPIGVLDSGIGGMSIFESLRVALPRENLLYVADVEHFPYGEKSPAFVEARARSLVKFMLSQHVKAIVIACNTATAVAIERLRSMVDIPLIGVEPGIRVAAAATRSKIVGVLATPLTLASERFRALVKREAQGLRIVQQPCSEIVDLVERAESDVQATRASIARCVQPLLLEGADVVVLGCTHLSAVSDGIRAEVGAGVAVVDPVTSIVDRILQVVRLEDAVAPPGRTRVIVNDLSGHVSRRVLRSVMRLGDVEVLPREFAVADEGR